MNIVLPFCRNRDVFVCGTELGARAWQLCTQLRVCVFVYVCLYELRDDILIIANGFAIVVVDNAVSIVAEPLPPLLLSSSLPLTTTTTMMPSLQFVSYEYCMYMCSALTWQARSTLNIRRNIHIRYIFD